VFAEPGPGEDRPRLIAMAGERIRFPGHTEISAVCTHPDARGRGLATALTRHVARAILDRGETPILHVRRDNHDAIRVYERLGFTVRRGIDFVLYRTPAAD
jgi:predicted GNAT family acetyltransferase